MNNIVKEMEILTYALRNDKDYFNSWQANIAMAIVDQFAKQGLKGDLIHNTANFAAKDFLKCLMRSRPDTFND